MNRNRKRRAVEKAISGDERVLLGLLKSKRHDVLNIARKIMRNEYDAEDVAQEVMIILERDICTLRNPEVFDAWVYRITYNECLRMKKQLSQKKSETIENRGMLLAEQRTELLPFENVVEEETQLIVVSFLDHLSDLQRECLTEFYFQGKSYVEIAHDLGVTTKEVDNALNRGKQKLRVLMGDDSQLLAIA